MNYRIHFIWKFSQITIIVLFLFGTISTAPAQTTLPAEEIAEKALAATVYLEMKDKNGKTLGIGSGFFVKPNLIATNYHVIEGAAKGTAKLVGKSTIYKIEGVTATDKTNDLALLKVTAFGIKVLSLGDSDKVRIGETVYVAGNPKGLEGTFSDGIISSRRDKLTKERLQMTAPISPGSSGGPVLNKKGQVIGVSFSVHRALDAQNLNFAIPSKYLKKLLEQEKPAKPLSQGKRSISAETYFRWGYEKYKSGDYYGSIADYTRAIQLKPNDAVIYYNRGLAKGKLKQHFAAIVDYDTAIHLKPDYVDAYNNRGLLKSKLGQHFAAIADFDIALRLKPDYALAYYNRGLEKYNLGQNLAAITDFDIALRLKLDFASAYVNRGNAKSNLGQNFAAIADFDMALRLKPDHTLAYYNRANEKYKLGQYGAAIIDYNQTLRLKPNFIEAYINRGIMKSLLGRTREAKQDLLTALRLAEKAGDTRLKINIKLILRKLD